MSMCGDFFLKLVHILFLMHFSVAFGTINLLDLSWEKKWHLLVLLSRIGICF
jgi:hypothetical protein